MLPRIYIETSVISYLTSRPSRDLLIAARQEATRAWWELRQTRYSPFVSILVLEEITRGDSVAAEIRLQNCAGFPVLQLDEECTSLAQGIIANQAIPATEDEDAVPIAIASLANMDVIASWNFAHLVGPFAKARLMRCISQLGFHAPLLATPEELLEELT